MIRLLRRWFTLDKDKRVPRSILIAVNFIFLVPVIWFARTADSEIQYTLPQVISTLGIGYLLLGLQVYGFILVVKLIMLFRKKIFMSEENLELYRRLGIILFSYVFAHYISSWVYFFFNKENVPDDHAIVFFTNDNVLYLCAGVLIYLAARYKQKQAEVALSEQE